MDLRSKYGHMRSGKVLVNGTCYHVDADGLVHGVTDLDAAKLLSVAGWEAQDGRAAPVVVPEARKVPDLRPTMIRTAAPAPKSELPGGDPWPTDDGDDEDGPAAVPEKPGPRLEPQPVAELRPAEAEKIPEPSMALSKAQLQGLADRYGVAYEAATTKRQLVDLLVAAMFEEEEVEESDQVAQGAAK